MVSSCGFLEIGFSNCVLPISKVEAATLRAMHDHEEVPHMYCKVRWVTDVAEHIRLCFNMLRQLKIEDDDERTTPKGRKQNSKTGGFRKRLSATDRIMVFGMMKRVVLAERQVLSRGASTDALAASGDGGSAVGAASTGTCAGEWTDSRENLLSRYQDLFSEKESPKRQKLLCVESDFGDDGEKEDPEDPEDGDEAPENEDEEPEGEDDGDYDESGVFKGRIGGKTFIDQKARARKTAVLEASAHQQNKRWREDRGAKKGGGRGEGRI